MILINTPQRPPNRDDVVFSLESDVTTPETPGQVVSFRILFENAANGLLVWLEFQKDGVWQPYRGPATHAIVPLLASAFAGYVIAPEDGENGPMIPIARDGPDARGVAAIRAVPYGVGIAADLAEPDIAWIDLYPGSPKALRIDLADEAILRVTNGPTGPIVECPAGVRLTTERPDGLSYEPPPGAQFLVPTEGTL